MTSALYSMTQSHVVKEWGCSIIAHDQLCWLMRTNAGSQFNVRKYRAILQYVILLCLSRKNSSSIFRCSSLIFNWHQYYFNYFKCCDFRSLNDLSFEFIYLFFIFHFYFWVVPYNYLITSFYNLAALPLSWIKIMFLIIIIIINKYIYIYIYIYKIYIHTHTWTDNFKKDLFMARNRHINRTCIDFIPRLVGLKTIWYLLLLYLFIQWF